LTDTPKRLIEVAFPLKQTSLDSVHEKNVRHGHISTLHIWPARRPLAACRAALIATLLPDPGNAEERKEMLEKLGGVIKTREKKKKDAEGRIQTEQEEYTEGGILHWGRESGPDLDWFRQKIREAYGGRAPKVLDPFAGGGAIPLEAMRLGCEATAVDINPVAWFILKCTLEYPQKLAGQKLPLPEFAVQDREFMEEYLKAQGFKGKELELQLEKFGFGKSASLQLPGMETAGVSLEADLAWHVRAWGTWVLKEARKELAPYYPTYADFEPLVEVTGKIEYRPMMLVTLKAEGTLDIDALNAEFTPEYLANKSNPRWVAKPAVAYLWARTVTCKNCRATIPLLKTRWLCKKPGKRVLLTMQPNAEKNGVVFGIQNDIPLVGKTVAERIAHDARLGGGTMSRSGASCPCCGGIMTTEDVRLEGKSGRLGSYITAVVVGGKKGKEYRTPTQLELNKIGEASQNLGALYKRIPFELPNEPTPIGGGSGAGRAFSVHNYGIRTWQSLFTDRQLLSNGYFILTTRNLLALLDSFCYEENWKEGIFAYLACILDRMINYNSSICIWEMGMEQVKQTFLRFALPITWDFVEGNPILDADKYYQGAINSNFDVLNGFLLTMNCPITPNVLINSATNKISNRTYDLIVTDPPYYDAIPYSDLMDFFYIWLKRSLSGLGMPEYDFAFSANLTPKWDKDANDGELIDDPSRFQGNVKLSKSTYEEGMFRSFQNCCQVLSENGRLVIVFANKQPDAWETLVSALIRAGFIVVGSWPIMTEMRGGIRNLNRASLSSSVWLVCKKRNQAARPGWDNKVLEEMHANIHTQLHDFWDAGIRGPDFVWAATGPAMEAYSQYPVVKKANQPGEVMTVSEFLVQARRMVVDFVVGRVLTGNGAEEVTGLDNITTYYLLHRHDFGINDAPAGPCILYAVSCGLSDKDLADRFDLLARRGGKAQDEQEGIDEGDEAVEEVEGSGSSFRLKAWNQRKNPRMGYDPATDGSVEKLPLFPEMQREVQPSREIPLIDQVHRLMHLWKGGDVSKVNEYLDLRGLRRNPLFHQLLQALIELAPAGSEERSLLESISNHVGGKQSTMQQMF
jgi:adenine-specific DNA methylase